jgi:hypothetical protein
MKKILYGFLLFILTFSGTQALEVDLGTQTISLEENKIQDPESFKKYIPKNWSLLQHATGDLNKDGIDDLVLIIQSDQALKLDQSDDRYFEDFPIYQRSMMIFFGNEDRLTLRRVVKNDSFIIHSEDPNMEDPFQGVSIERNNLVLKFGVFMNAGSWTVTSTSYVFRYQNGDFALIGADASEFHRGSGESIEFSINFLTKKYSRTVKNEFDESVKHKITWHTFTLSRLRTLLDLNRPWNWAFLPELTL